MTSGADIDTLLVAPRHIERTDYFGTFPEFLREKPEATQVHVCKLNTESILSPNYV